MKAVGASRPNGKAQVDLRVRTDVRRHSLDCIHANLCDVANGSLQFGRCYLDLYRLILLRRTRCYFGRRITYSRLLQRL